MPGILRVKYVSSFFILKSEQNRKLASTKGFLYQTKLFILFYAFFICVALCILIHGE